MSVVFSKGEMAMTEERDNSHEESIKKKGIFRGNQKKQLPQGLRPRKWVSVLMKTSQAEVMNTVREERKA